MSNPNSNANSWDERYAAQEFVWSLEPNQFVVQHLQDLKPSKMIDLAGGEGRNALWFAQRGWQVENVEISKVALDKFMARAERDKVLDLCLATLSDATQAHFALAADLLVIAYLQLPFDQLVEAMNNAISQLEPGAEVLGVWHARRNLTDGVGGPPMPEVLPEPAQLKDWAEGKLVSFEVFESERMVEKDGEVRAAIDVILKGQLPKS
uniref:class I SAM-dependent methyltransferase n=1 Tax=Aquiluna sp. TaxID=2053504 RepID=UPI004047886A